MTTSEDMIKMTVRLEPQLWKKFCNMLNDKYERGHMANIEITGLIKQAVEEHLGAKYKSCRDEKNKLLAQISMARKKAEEFDGEVKERWQLEELAETKELLKVCKQIKQFENANI